MATLKEVFDSVGEMIQEQVEEMDKLGYADKFKSATEKFFDVLQNETYYFNSAKITVYLDGYFIFGFGTNSVIHFRVKEAPGWLFGIWWDTSDKTLSSADGEHVKGEFFCQYEDTIDKFKPTASVLTADFSVGLTNNNINIYEVNRIITFIIRQPYLAFCRDYCAWNYNHEYHSPRKARKEFKKYKKQSTIDSKVRAKNNAKVLKWVEKYILPHYAVAEITDRGDAWSPRYEVFVPYSENKDILNVDGPGSYRWFQSEDELLYKMWTKFTDRLHKKALKKDVYWYAPIHASVEIYDIKEPDKGGQVDE